MDKNGFKDTIIVAYEHNWDDAGAYPVEVVGTTSPRIVSSPQRTTIR